MRKLTLADIKDTRAYERERDEFRRHIIDLKRRRRIALGTIMTIVFENTDTMRFQVQEMARAERMMTDAQIEHEVEKVRPLSAVRVIVPYVGGGYGSKSYTKIEPLTAALALRAGRPVRLALDVDDSILTTRGDGATVELRTAFDRDGHILGRHAADLLVHFQHLRAPPDQQIALARLIRLVQMHGRLHQAAHFQRALHDFLHFLLAQRLEHVVVGAQFHGLDRQAAVVGGGDKDHRQLGVDFRNLLS